MQINLSEVNFTFNHLHASCDSAAQLLWFIFKKRVHEKTKHICIKQTKELCADPVSESRTRISLFIKIIMGFFT